MLVGVLLGGCNAVFNLDETGLVNENPRTLTFDNSDGDEDLVGFPVPVFLDSTRVNYEAVITPATDLRFHDPDTNADLPFEIEVWNPAGASVVWVRVPTINARSITDRILMYAGADSAGHEDTAVLWSDYELVVHGATAAFTSSAGRTFDVRPTDVTIAAGPLGNAVGFGKRTSELAYGSPNTQLFDDWEAFTFEVSIYLDYADGETIVGEPRVLENDAGAHLGRFLPRTNLPGVMVLQTDWTFASAGNELPTYLQAVLVTRRWAHIVYAYDGRKLWLYRDGLVSAVDGFAAISPILPAANSLRLGHSSDAFNGRLDEIRVSRKYRSPAWVYAQDLAQRDKLITFPRPGERL